MDNQKVTIEIILLFFVSLLGGLISTIIYRLNLSITMMMIITFVTILTISGLVVFWEFGYKRHRRQKDFSDKKETRNNTREILEQLKAKK